MAASAASRSRIGRSRRKRRRHNSPATRRASMASALALMVFVACVDNAAPAGAASPTPQNAATAQANPAAPIRIRAVRDTPEAAAQIFGTLLAREARQDKLPLDADTARGDYTLRGALGAGQGLEGVYLIAVLDLHGKEDTRLHRVVTEARATGPAAAQAASHDGQGAGAAVWERVRQQDMERLAAESVARLAQWYAANRKTPARSATSMVATNAPAGDEAGDDALITGSIRPDLPVTTPDGKGGPGQRLAAASPFRIDVAPAPGDGDRALTSAMEKALAERLKERPEEMTDGPYKVTGEVVTASRNDGQTDVSIRWVLKGPQGKTLGEVRQNRAVAAAAIAGHWGPLAEQAARAAAEGILKLMAPAGPAKAAQG